VGRHRGRDGRRATDNGEVLYRHLTVVPDQDSVPDQDAGTAARPAVRDTAFYLGAVLTALFMLRLLGASWSSGFPAAWPDAVFPREGYLAVAAKGPFRFSFYDAFRPIGYPTLLWITGRNTQLTVVAQTAIYCAAVGALVMTALRTLKVRAVAIITALLIGLIALQAKYAMWNTQILSESLAITLGFATVAAWWRFASSPSRARARWGFLFLIAWLLVRDAHVLPATIVFVPVMALVVLLGRKSLGRALQRTLVIGTVLVVVTAAYSYFAQGASHRARLSVHNTVGVRILPDEQLTDWFVDHSMPLDDALRSRTGKSGLAEDFYKSTDPEFARYRAWASGPGARTIALSLVMQAPHYYDLLYRDLPSLLPGDVSYYDTQGVYDRLPRELPAQLGGPTTRRGLTSWLVLAGASLVVGLALALRRRRGLGVVVFGATTLVLTLVELYTTWGGDPLEMPRHLIGTFGRLAIILVVVVASGVDTAIDAWRTRTPRAAQAPEPTPPDAEGEAEHAAEVAPDA
jgi:hypothetical protein